jgi:hypothetical protein
MIVELKAPPHETSRDDLRLGRSSPPPARTERRREMRYPTNDPVDIQLLDAGGGPLMEGKVLDVSRSGLRLELRAPFSKGLRLKIALRDRTIIFGETRYCLRASPFYHVGVAIEAVFYAFPSLGVHVQDEELNLYVHGEGLRAAAAIQVKNHLFSCGSCQVRLARAQALRLSGTRRE